MANSRSTIYPVQLQGAELNLNKYDAEIKQYSGFNKNNSPFVGGCLSNVFTREESYSPGSFISPDGSVYSVVDGYLCRDGIQLLEIQDGVSLHKINIALDIVYMFNEDVYLYLLDNKLYLHIYDNIQNIRTLNTRDLGSCYNIQKINNNYYFSVVTRFQDGNAKDNVIYGYFDTDTETFVIRERNDNVLGLRVELYSGVWHSDNGVVCFYRTDKTLSSDWSVETTFSSDANVSVNSYSFYFWYVKGGKLYGCLDARALLTKNANEVQSSGGYAYYIYYPIPIEIVYNPTTRKMEGSKETQRLVCKIPELGSTWQPSSIDISSTVKKYFNFGVVDTCCLFQKTVQHSMDGYLEAFGISDFKTVGVKAPTNSYYYSDSDFTTGAIIDNTVLINNNEISALSYNDVVVTGWFDDIDERSICKHDGELYFKVSDVYYKVIPDELKILNVVNDCIITNGTKGHNAYNLKTKESFRFADNWNNRLYQDKILNNDLTLTAPFTWDQENIYFCSSKNEYNKNGIQSVSFNPVQIYYISGSVPPYQFSINSPDRVMFNNNYDIVNYYFGNEGAVIYNYSDYGNNDGYYFRVEELYQMPYPVITDGNIILSPSLFETFVQNFSDTIFVKIFDKTYLLMKYNNDIKFNYYFGSLVDNFQDVFSIQGNLFVIVNNHIYYTNLNNSVIVIQSFIVSIEGLQFVGNTPYEALFFSKTNRCLYSFTGANVLNQKQLVDKISEVRNYLYNPATQTVFLITDIGVLFYGLFGMFLLEYTNISNIFLLDNGIVMSDNNGNYRYVKYYLDEGDTDYEKQNIRLETSFYGMNNEMVTINDCLYFRIFSEEHEEGDLKVSATTISLSGRKTEETTFKIKASDWDKITHTIYLRYQPKTQRGLGVAFAIDSPFKIASLSVGSQPDAVLVDKVSKGAITAPSVTTNNNEW